MSSLKVSLIISIAWQIIIISLSPIIYDIILNLKERFQPELLVFDGNEEYLFDGGYNFVYYNQVIKVVTILFWIYLGTISVAFIFSVAFLINMLLHWKKGSKISYFLFYLYFIGSIISNIIGALYILPNVIKTLKRKENT